MFKHRRSRDFDARLNGWRMLAGRMCLAGSAAFAGLLAAGVDLAAAFDLSSWPEVAGNDAVALETSSGVTVKQSSDNINLSWATPADVAGMSLDLSFVTDEGDPSPISRLIPGEEVALDRQLLSMKGKIRYSDLVSLNFSQKVEDRSDISADFVGMGSDDADQNPDQLLTSNVTLGLGDNRLRLTRRLSWSNFDASRFDFGDSHEDNSGDDAPYLGSGENTGLAILERADAKLFRSPNFSLSVFGLRNTVDEYYRTFEDEKKKTEKEDPLKVPNRVTFKYGAKADVGPFALDMAQYAYRPADAGDGSPPQEQGYEAKLSLNLVDVRRRTEIKVGEAFWSLAPTSLWVKYTEGSVDVAAIDAAPRDFKSEVSAGGTWGLNNFYGSLSYWHSVYDSRQIDSGDADWAGRGIDVSAGYSRAFWGVDATVSLGDYHNYGDWYQTAERSYDGTIGGWLNFKDLPALKASLSLGRYATDDHLYSADNSSDYLELGVTVDFTKYLAESGRNPDRSMKLYYGLDHSLTRDESSSSQQSLNDHTVLLRYSTGL